MELHATIPGIKSLADNIWEAEISPSEVRKLQDGAKSVGAVSVIILSSKPVLDANKLKFELDDIFVANVGSTSRALIIDGIEKLSAADRIRIRVGIVQKNIPEGDKAFLNSLSALPEEVRLAGQQLLKEIRVHFPGELKRISDTRFQETPDNFWFVTVQPRAESILITVRGLPDRFSPSPLNIKEDRRPYSRFKVRSAADVSEAVRIIRAAIRKV